MIRGVFQFVPEIVQGIRLPGASLRKGRPARQERKQQNRK